MLIDKVGPYDYYFCNLKKNRKKFVLALVELYINSKDGSSKNTLKHYILQANNGESELKPIEFLVNMPDDPLQRKVQLTFNNCLFTSKTRERKTVQNERRNLFIAPIIAGAISLFLIALGITVCLLHQATISAVIFFFVVGCASLIGSQAYFWGVADVPSKTRLKKLSSLSSIIKENRFDQDTFIGTAFKEQDLTDAFGRSNVNILSSHLSPQPNRYQLWYATKSTESDKSIESDSFDFQ